MGDSQKYHHFSVLLRVMEFFLKDWIQGKYSSKDMPEAHTMCFIGREVKGEGEGSLNFMKQKGEDHQKFKPRFGKGHNIKNKSTNII